MCTLACFILRPRPWVDPVALTPSWQSCLFCCAPYARGSSLSDEEHDWLCLFSPRGNRFNKVLLFVLYHCLSFHVCAGCRVGNGRIRRSKVAVAHARRGGWNAAVAQSFQTLIPTYGQVERRLDTHTHTGLEPLLITTSKQPDVAGCGRLALSSAVRCWAGHPCDWTPGLVGRSGTITVITK